MICRNCGKEILESANFCRYCGAKVLREPPSFTPVEKAAAPVRAQKNAGAHSGQNPSAAGRKKGLLALAAAAVLLVGGLLSWYFLKSSKQTEPEALEDQLSRAETWQERYALGQDRLAQEDYDGAIAAFASALELDGAEDAVHADLARACYLAKKYEQALQEYEALAASGAEPYYEPRTQCLLALGRKNEAGALLHDAYLQTGDARMQDLARENWDAEALHAYGAYVGFDADYAFGLFDWNHDLTPELFYVWNGGYGNSVGADFRILTYRDGAVQQLYTAHAAAPSGSLTADGGFFFSHPATHGYFMSTCLDWDGAQITEQNFLDCYLDWSDLSGYTLHPEYNYRWESDDADRGCFLNTVQVAQDELSRVIDARREGEADLALYPVMEKACKEQLDYDWDTLSQSGAPSYAIRTLPDRSICDTTYSFGSQFAPASDANPIYGNYAVVRADTGGVAEMFSLPFDDFEQYSNYYADDTQTPVQIGDCYTFALWYGPGMLCSLTYDAQEKALYELEPGNYSEAAGNLLYSELTYDVDSPRSFRLVTPHGEEIDTLLDRSVHAGYCEADDIIYVWGSPAPQSGYSITGELREMAVYSYRVSTREKTELAHLQAAYILDVGADYIKYQLSWDDEERTLSLPAAASETGPALSAETRPERALYPRPERTLKAGMTGEDVKYIQAMLIAMNYDVPSVTGAFDKTTEASLIAWQKRHEYAQTGVVDAQTLEQMEQAEEIWLKKQNFDPDFTFSTLDTAGASWTADRFKDHTLTMLNLWASWCGPCVSEMPDLQRLYENYSKKGLNIVGIMEGSQSDLDTLSELGITYPNIYLTQELEDVMYTGYVPTTIFVDASGRIVDAHYVGARSYDEWAEIIEALL